MVHKLQRTTGSQTPQLDAYVLHLFQQSLNYAMRMERKTNKQTKNPHQNTTKPKQRNSTMKENASQMLLKYAKCQGTSTVKVYGIILTTACYKLSMLCQVLQNKKMYAAERKYRLVSNHQCLLCFILT